MFDFHQHSCQINMIGIVWVCEPRTLTVCFLSIFFLCVCVFAGRQREWCSAQPWVALNSLSTSADPSAHGAAVEPSVWLRLLSANQCEEATTHNWCRMQCTHTHAQLESPGEDIVVEVPISKHVLMSSSDSPLLFKTSQSAPPADAVLIDLCAALRPGCNGHNK